MQLCEEQVHNMVCVTDILLEYCERVMSGSCCNNCERTVYTDCVREQYCYTAVCEKTVSEYCCKRTETVSELLESC